MKWIVVVADDRVAADGWADLAEASGWIPVASGLASLRLGNVEGPAASLALRLDYDFAGGGGFVVARREVALDLPESWDLVLFVRGDAPANTLEVKFVDTAGTSVWRWTHQAFAPPREWTELRIASRDAAFAWGPAGGGSIRRTSALEIAIVAAPGGRGSVDVGGFRIIDRSPNRTIVATATSSASDSMPAMAMDGDARTSWLSAGGQGPHALTLDLGEQRNIGGLVVRWAAGTMPTSFRIEASQVGEARRDGESSQQGDAVPAGEPLRDAAALPTVDGWTVVHRAPLAGAAVNFVDLPALSVRRLRVVASGGDGGVGIAQIDVKAEEWSRSAAEFLTGVALASRRGEWPRYLLREQSYWTPLASPLSGPAGLMNDDGAVEVGEGGFLLEPSLLVAPPRGSSAALRWITWADAERSAALASPPLPVPTVAWRAADITLEVTAVVEDGGDADVIVVRYRLTNHGADHAAARICVALRPVQVTPPWQAFRGLGGPSPILGIDGDERGAVVNDSVRVEPLTAAADFGVAAFDEGGVGAALAAGLVPTRRRAADAVGRAEGVFAFDAGVAAGASAEVFVECRVPKRRGAKTSVTGASAASVSASAPVAAATAVDEAGRVAAAQGRMTASLEQWRLALPLPAVVTVCEAARSAHDGAATAVAHILACRDGAALQPGARRYTRSWIRDGAIMAAALARAGRVDAARDFVQWYAPFQRGDGYVPCCVDRDGVDPLVEHDSHGQLVYAVAETYRFSRDTDFVRRLWPRCAKAAAFLETLRATRRSDEYRQGPLAACFGLLPESVSHEGYLAQAVHSYWDDFWALRGLRDAAFLARELGLASDAERWSAAATDLGAAIAASMLTVMRDRGLETVPASVEWADFDPTAVAGAISLVGVAELFPAEALARTFDEYLKGFRARRDGAVAWSNYTPYEVRIVGALVRLGRRGDANEVLDFLLGDRRPVAWGQWPEIAWRDPAAPAHLGDLPHCWIGAEYGIALRTMLVFEREVDGALVIGAGLRREWIDAPGGFAATAIPTWYGSVDLSIRRGEDGVYRVSIAGAAAPPGGFVTALPEGCEVVVERA